MPEPTDPFSHFDPEVAVPLSAVEVRRRGDRLRRRNTGLAVAGAVAVVALVATPLAVLGTGGDPDVLPPAATPTTSAPDPAPPATPAPEQQEPLVTEVPDGFPLADGYPDTNEDLTPVEVRDDVPTTSFSLCFDQGTTQDFAPDTSALTDLASVQFSQPEDFRTRMVTVWADEASAAAALASARETLAGCSPDGFAYTERPSSYGADAAVFTVQAGPDPAPAALGLDVYEVVQVRNAVYLSHTYGEGGPRPEDAFAGVERSFADSAPVVAAAYDVFGGGSAGAPEPTEPTEAGPGLLGLEDLPTRTRLGAWAADPDDATTWECAPPGLFTGLGAESSTAARYAASGADDEGGPAIARVRTAVLQLSDEQAALEAYDLLQDTLAGCAVEDDRFRALDREDASAVGGDDATWYGVTYAAPDICTDCDAVWFDRMGIARIGERLVVLSYAEVGGPLQPGGLERAMREVMTRAVELA